MIDLWAEENAPAVKEVFKVYSIRIPSIIDRAIIYVEVDQYDCISLHNSTYWFGKDWKLDWQVREEVYEYLIEWEFAEWKPIGPEDRELFATPKLLEAASV